jgi:hypothetical protein
MSERDQVQLVPGFDLKTQTPEVGASHHLEANNMVLPDYS